MINNEQNQNYIPQEPVVSEETRTPQAQTETNQTVGFWAFFGLILLFSLPVIGFIACIVFMFAPKKKSTKNYARAVMTWMLLKVIAFVLVVTIAFSFLGTAILPTLNEQLGTKFQRFSQVVGVVVDVTRGDYTTVIVHLQPQLLDMLGEEYAPFLDELATGEYNDLIDQFKNKQYDELLTALKRGDYADLVATLDADVYDAFVQELEVLAAGGSSEALDEIHNYIDTLVPIDW